MYRKKTIFIASTVFIFIIVVISVIAVINSSNQEQSTNNDSNVLFKIDGLDKPSYLFSSDTQQAIALGIDQYLKADDIKTGGIVGIIRKDSYSKEEEFDATISTLLIDIPDIKRTYKVFSSGSGDPDGDNRLMIICPSQDELIYGKFDCKDDTL